jgi:hypothetical protein
MSALHVRLTALPSGPESACSEAGSGPLSVVPQEWVGSRRRPCRHPLPSLDLRQSHLLQVESVYDFVRVTIVLQQVRVGRDGRVIPGGPVYEVNRIGQALPCGLEVDPGLLPLGAVHGRSKIMM